jgi:hypothetical protein
MPAASKQETLKKNQQRLREKERLSACQGNCMGIREKVKKCMQAQEFKRVGPRKEKDISRLNGK